MKRSAVDHLLSLVAVQVKPYVRHGPHGVPVPVVGYVRHGAPSVNDRAAAQSIRTEAMHHEPYVTGVMKEVESMTGGRLDGLEFRLKSVKSLSRKIRDERGPRSPYEQAKSIADVLRYTDVIPYDTYTENVQRALRFLREHEGWTVRSKNYWKKGDPYDGINVALTTREGMHVEVQFHTEESLKVRNRVHLIYERFRVSEDNAERRKLYQRMVLLASRTRVPPGVEAIPIEKFIPYQDLPGVPVV